MNDFRLPRNEKRVDSRCASPFEPQRSRRSTSIAVLIWPLAIVGATVQSAAAQTTIDANNVPVAAEEQDQSSEPDPFSNKWKFLLGGGAANGARYPGSRYYFTRALPLVSVSYGRYFFGAVPGSGAPAGAGAYLLHTEHWAVGVNIGGDTRKPRRASDDPILRGWATFRALRAAARLPAMTGTGCRFAAPFPTT